MAYGVWLLAIVTLASLFWWAWKLADKIDNEERERIKEELRKEMLEPPQE